MDELGLLRCVKICFVNMFVNVNITQTRPHWRATTLCKHFPPAVNSVRIPVPGTAVTEIVVGDGADTQQSVFRPHSAPSSRDSLMDSLSTGPC